MINFLFSKLRGLTARRAAAPPSKRQKRQLSVESLEPRQLMATLSVNANQIVRTTTDNLLGVNVSVWAGANDQETHDLVEAAGLRMFRITNGSMTDYTHFVGPRPYDGADTVVDIASFVDGLHGEGLVTLDYGSGSPQEAAAELAYLNGSIDNITPIGSGPIWDDQTHAWAMVDWKTADYWASLRAATPLLEDDGLNFMRLGRSEPFGFHRYEVGNEVYGFWETDHHGQGGDLGKAHDPNTYAVFAKSFANLAMKIDPTISIGVCIDDPNTKWNTGVMQALKNQQFMPGFLSDHIYPLNAGKETDSQLLHSVSDPGSPYNLKNRSNSEKLLLQSYFGSAGNKVELLVTEFNSVSGLPGKQTISLVNGLFVADMVGSLLQTSYNGAMFWDLRNGYQLSGNNSSALYGWRTGGDLGLLGGPGPAPATGQYVAYPQYYAEQLLSKIIHDGDKVVSVTSNDLNLSAYAVRQASGKLDLLVINKNPSAATTGSFQMSGFQPAASAQVWQYGQAQDNAQKNSSDGSSGLSNFTTKLTLSGNNFSYRFPAYSMTVLELSPRTVQQPPTYQPPTNQPPTNQLPATGSPKSVNLATAYNRVGIVADGARFGSGLDNGSAALSASLVGSQVNFGGVTYLTGPIGAANVVAAQGQSINLPSGNYKSLNILATGVKGNQANQTFTVRYTDGTSQTFTRSISDWYTPQSYAGESIALKMSYRNTSAGLRDNRPFYLYSYSLPLNNAKSVRSITLPGNSNVEILAMTAVN